MLDLKDIPTSRLPSLVETIVWALNPLQYYERCREKFGPVFRIKIFGWADLVMVSDPEVVKDIYAQPRSSLLAGETNKILEPMVGPDSVFVLDGEQHSHARRSLQPPLKSQQLLRQGAMINESISGFLNNLDNGRDLSELFREITLSVMVKVLFGEKSLNTPRAYQKILFPLLGPITGLLAFVPPLRMDFGRFSPFGWYRGRVKAFSNLIYGEINAQKTIEELSASQSRSMLQHLLRLQKEDNIVSDEWVKNQIISLFVAGNDTSAAGMAWATYWIYSRPDIIQKLRYSLPRVDQFDDEVLNTIMQDKYLDNVYQEALRVLPVIDFYSRIRTDFCLKTEPKQVFISPCSFLFQRDEKIFNDPKAFVPERFEDNKFDTGNYSPYGGGVRRCIGIHLAEMLIKLTIFQLVQRFTFEIKGFDSVKPRRRNVILAPSKLIVKSLKFAEKMEPLATL
ncbi:cytochrome P450 [Teredinibacter waterburyi]|uniref:cytochrome P450 n=1 Tax=Teredinibacter waterburyi TaxID=1500538 RepID=UPI00165FB69C|nr:cytochrome P450 [Teredinibacter waterburyi]